MSPFKNTETGGVVGKLEGGWFSPLWTELVALAEDKDRP